MKRGHLSMLLLSSIIVLAVLPSVSALFDSGFSFDILNNEWVKFGIIFVLLFGSIYSFLIKKMQNTPAAVIITLGLSALISIPIMERGLIDPFLSPDIVDWTIIIAFAAMFIFFYYKFGMRIDDYGRRRFSKFGLLIFLAILIFIVYLIGDYLPNNVMYGPVGDSLEWIKSLSLTMIVIVIILLIIGIWWRRHEQKRGYLWEGRYKAAGQQRAQRGWFGRKKDRGYGTTPDAGGFQ